MGVEICHRTASLDEILRTGGVAPSHGGPSLLSITHSMICVGTARVSTAGVTGRAGTAGFSAKERSSSVDSCLTTPTTLTSATTVLAGRHHYVCSDFSSDSELQSLWSSSASSSESSSDSV
jgi:hypothetical protein